MFLKKDELIGLWTREDDGTGFLSIFGWSICFKKDGNGIYTFWENEDEIKIYFKWERIAKKKIKIITDSSVLLEYDIHKSTKVQSLKYFKLSEIMKTSFWLSPEPLYKRRIF